MHLACGGSQSHASTANVYLERGIVVEMTIKLKVTTQNYFFYTYTYLSEVLYIVVCDRSIVCDVITCSV